MIDSIVFDLSKFASMHPGGSTVLLDADVGECSRPTVRSAESPIIAGKDATTAFFGLHRSEILFKPQCRFTAESVGSHLTHPR